MLLNTPTPTFIYCYQQLYSCKHLFSISEWTTVWTMITCRQCVEHLLRVQEAVLEHISLNTGITCGYYWKSGGNWAATPILSYLRWQMSCHPYSFLPLVTTELPPLLFLTFGGNWAATLTLSYPRWQLSCHPYSFLPLVATELPPLLFLTLGGNWAVTPTLSNLRWQLSYHPYSFLP